MRVLLLEDDPETSAFIDAGLRELGHAVCAYADGRQALDALLQGSFDVLVIDRMVPGMDGLTTLRLARENGCSTPALLLTAMAGIEDRVAGLEQGADDYLVKPFAFVELAARLNALARRPPRGEVNAVLRAGELEMDLLRRVVRRGGRTIEVQPKEFSLLEQLMRNADRVVTRTMLLDRVWNFGFDPKTNIVETHMSRLRTKLNEGFATDAIRTVRGSGYTIRTDAA